MKIKMTTTIAIWNLRKNQILNETDYNDEFKASLVKEGLADEIQSDEVDDSTVDIYVAKVYPNRMKVIKDNAMYKADVGDGNNTSSSWVANEWTLILQGA